jgi:sulfate adenylyltransferase
MEDRSVISPCGGRLVDLRASSEELQELLAMAKDLPSIRLTDRNVCDLELLAVGAFSPLDRFMGRQDYERVLGEMRLGNGHLFSVPVTLPVDSRSDIRLDRQIALRDSRNEILAVMTVEEIYPYHLEDFAGQLLGTTDPRHPLVAEMHGWGNHNISGTIRVLRLPKHHDVRELRLEPTEVRARLSAMGAGNVVAFQTRNPMHRAHEELTKRAIAELNAVLLLQPAVGMTRPGDVDYYTRVRTYKLLAERYYDPARIVLSLLPLAMRMAGPREALWHALIRRHYGANYLIVGRDHAGPGKDSSGRAFYGPYEAQDLLARFGAELGVGLVRFSEMVYLVDEARYEEASRIPADRRTLSISGTEVREQYLNAGRRLPEWFTRPEVAAILEEAHPPKHRQGVCIWFTGLSGAGKSTTAEVLTQLLLECGRRVTILDGDVVRTHLSKGLGFTKDDRDINIRRIGFVASEVVRHGGVAVCAAVSPYRATRNDVRAIVGADKFVEVFVDTPLDVCEARDSKGMYAKARRGELTGFTGINDPYEAPLSPEITLDTTVATANDNARLILEYLRLRGFVKCA